MSITRPDTACVRYGQIILLKRNAPRRPYVPTLPGREISVKYDPQVASRTERPQTHLSPSHTRACHESIGISRPVKIG